MYNKNYRYKRERFEDKYRTNGQIPPINLRVIGSDGSQIGILHRNEALRLATEQGLDLIEISAKVQPPIVKIMDFSKFKFETLKKEKISKRNNKQKEAKEMRFKPLIGENDLNHKVSRIIEFLGDKRNVKITILLGRKSLPEKAKLLMSKILEKLSEYCIIEGEVSYEARRVICFVRPSKVVPKQNENKNKKNTE